MSRSTFSSEALKSSKQGTNALQDLLNSATEPGNSIEWKSHITGTVYTFVYKELKSPLKNPPGSPFNKRSGTTLNKYMVEGISSSIHEAKRNKNPVLLKGTSTDYTVVEGRKRHYTVENTEDGVLVAFIVKDLMTEDEQYLATVGDQYEKPNTIDIALSVKKIGNMKVDDIEQQFSISGGSASNVNRISKLPVEFFDCFPTTSSTPVRLAIDICKYLKAKGTDFSSVFGDVQAYSEFVEGPELDVNQEAAFSNVIKKVEKQFSDLMKEEKEPKSPKLSKKLNSKTGEYTYKIPKGVSADIIEQIDKLLGLAEEQ